MKNTKLNLVLKIVLIVAAVFATIYFAVGLGLADVDEIDYIDSVSDVEDGTQEVEIDFSSIEYEEGDVFDFNSYEDFEEGDSGDADYSDATIDSDGAGELLIEDEFSDKSGLYFTYEPNPDDEVVTFTLDNIVVNEDSAGELEMFGPEIDEEISFEFITGMDKEVIGTEDPRDWDMGEGEFIDADVELSYTDDDQFRMSWDSNDEVRHVGVMIVYDDYSDTLYQDTFEDVGDSDEVVIDNIDDAGDFILDFEIETSDDEAIFEYHFTNPDDTTDIEFIEEGTDDSDSDDSSSDDSDVDNGDSDEADDDEGVTTGGDGPTTGVIPSWLVYVLAAVLAMMALILVTGRKDDDLPN